MKLTCHDVAAAVHGVLHGPNALVNGVSTDTRALTAGQLFVPLRGPNFDGHAFIDAAFATGAAASLVAGDCERRLDDHRVYIEVPDTQVALGELGRAWALRVGATRVAITGSNGKTTTKDLVALVLAAYGPTHKTWGNHNNLIGLPLTLLSMVEGTRFAALEMGMNAPGEIAALTRLGVPHIGLVTSIGAAHLEGLGSIEGVAAAKGELFLGLARGATAIVNAFDPRVAQLPVAPGVKRLVVGPKPGADLLLSRITREGTAGFSAVLTIGAENHKLSVRSLARHDVVNAALAVAVVHALGLPLGPALGALASASPEPAAKRGRLGWVRTGSGVNIIDDTYNANPASMRAAVEALCEVSAGVRRFAVLGDMLELGDGASALHRDIGMLASDLGVDALFAVGRYSDDYASGYDGDKVICGGDVPEILDQLLMTVKKGDWVLVKGSRGARMERVVEALIDAGKASSGSSGARLRAAMGTTGTGGSAS
jgi:UDP-N-acetylmuramoyl-tripeptide--D-alanyl-D-alanine ligase